MNNKLLYNISNKFYKCANEPIKSTASLGNDAIHLALDIAGFIPGYGEVADLTNAILYAKESKYLFAALSIISMIPEIGDVIGKSTKLIAYLQKTAPKATEFVSKHGPKVIDVINNMKVVIKENETLINAIFDKLESNEKINKYIDDIKEALDIFKE